MRAYRQTMLTDAGAGIDGSGTVMPRGRMTASLPNALEQACQSFACQPGEIAAIVQSRSNPAIVASVNESAPFPSASVIKAAIACAAADHLDLTQQMNVSDLDDTFYCSILQAFEPDDRLTLRTLIGLMLIVSDNPATTAILDAVGMDRVNEWLQSNGLKNTHIDIGFGDAALGTPLRANQTMAADCLRLLRIIDTEPSYAFVKHMLANNLRNERIPKLLPDEAVIAHKTGTLNGLCHDIAIIESPDAAFYLVVLADGLSEGHEFANVIAGFSRQIYDLMSE